MILERKINFARMKPTTEKRMLYGEEERIKARLATTPTERFMLLVNLIKLNKKLKTANAPK